MSTVEKSDGDEYVDPYLYVTGCLMEELYKKTQITSKAMETIATSTTLNYMIKMTVVGISQIFIYYFHKMSMV
jgi:hypothetical protein